MIIKQTLTQPTSYAELGAITHQIEQSQREVQCEITLQVGLLWILRGACPIVATATRASDKVATGTTILTTLLGALWGLRGGEHGWGCGDWGSS